MATATDDLQQDIVRENDVLHTSYSCDIQSKTTAPPAAERSSVQAPIIALDEGGFSFLLHRRGSKLFSFDASIAAHHAHVYVYGHVDPHASIHRSYYASHRLLSLRPIIDAHARGLLAPRAERVDILRVFFFLSFYCYFFFFLFRSARVRIVSYGHACMRVFRPTTTNNNR